MHPNRVRARIFLAAVAVPLLGVPPGAWAQQPARVRKVGVLAASGERTRGTFAFEGSLEELGWIVGKTITIEWRNTAGSADPGAHAANAAELARLPVDVLVAWGFLSARAAQQATQRIPIIAALVLADPVAAGFVQNMTQPEGNLTAVTPLTGMGIGWKRLQLFKECLPGMTRLAVLDVAAEPIPQAVRDEFQAVRRALGVESMPVVVRSLAEVDPALRQAKEQGAQALWVPLSNFAYVHRRQIAEAALANRLPSAAWFYEEAEAGALMSYAISLPEYARVVARYVDKILKGAKVADLPVQQPDRYELVFNLKTARALGLTIPRALLLQADVLIE